MLAGLTAREFGGGRRAQLLAAVATATMPVVLGGDHLFGPTAFDILAWAALALVVAKIGRTGDVRWWPACGLVLGLGLANKHSVGLFALALVIGVFLSGGRRLVLNRWFLAGAVIAVVFTIPDIWWQAQHQWATIAMSGALARENGGLVNIANWVIGQLTMSALALVGVWVAGLRFLWRSGLPAGAPWCGRTRSCSCSSRSRRAGRSTTWRGRTSTCSRPGPWPSTAGWPPAPADSAGCCWPRR